MADVLSVHAASALIYTGKGQIAGVVISSSTAGVAQIATFYDNTAGSGTKLLESYISTFPVVIFFEERFSPTFATGLYLVLAANMIVTVWTRQL